MFIFCNMVVLYNIHVCWHQQNCSFGLKISIKSSFILIFLCLRIIYHILEQRIQPKIKLVNENFKTKYRFEPQHNYSRLLTTILLLQFQAQDGWLKWNFKYYFHTDHNFLTSILQDLPWTALVSEKWQAIVERCAEGNKAPHTSKTGYLQWQHLTEVFEVIHRQESFPQKPRQ